MNTKYKKGIINALIFLFFVILTFSIIFQNKDITQIWQTIQQVDQKFVMFAIGCMVCFILSEGINIRRTLTLLDCKVSLKNSLKYALVGFFFSSVTPSASGGDPMQIYAMKKDGLPMGASALAILVEFSSFQLVTIVMAVIGFVINSSFIESSVGNIKYLLLLGVSINVAIFMVVLGMIFSKKWIKKLIYAICQMREKFQPKKAKEFRRKCFQQVKEYKKGAQLLKEHPQLFLKIVGTTSIQILLYHSIPYLIYVSFGLHQADFWQFLTLQAVLYIAVSALPFPGAVGVSEGGFLGVYQVLFPEQFLNSAMLLSRGISFYLFVMISGVLLLYFYGMKKASSG